MLHQAGISWQFVHQFWEELPILWRTCFAEGCSRTLLEPSPNHQVTRNSRPRHSFPACKPRQTEVIQESSSTVGQFRTFHKVKFTQINPVNLSGFLQTYLWFFHIHIPPRRAPPAATCIRCFLISFSFSSALSKCSRSTEAKRALVLGDQWRFPRGTSNYPSQSTEQPWWPRDPPF